MIHDFMDSPEKMAAYLTDNVLLQRYYVHFLNIKDDAERKNWEMQFWQEVADLPQQEQDLIRQAHSKIAQRLHDRMSGILATAKALRTRHFVAV